MEQMSFSAWSGEQQHEQWPCILLLLASLTSRQSTCMHVCVRGRFIACELLKERRQTAQTAVFASLCSKRSDLRASAVVTDKRWLFRQPLSSICRRCGHALGALPRCFPAAYSFFFYICKQGCSVLADPGSEEVLINCCSFVQCRAGRCLFKLKAAIPLRSLT